MESVNEWRKNNLKTRWFEITHFSPLPKKEKQEILQTLFDKYNSKKRHYHDLKHITEMLENFDQHKELAFEPLALQFAIFFHDVIYKPFSKNNEIQSALFAETQLLRLSAEQDLISQVKKLILITQSHELEVLDNDLALMIDLDLMVFGKDPRKYNDYFYDVSREFSFLPSSLFRWLRKKFIKKLLKKPQIYHHKKIRDLYENTARVNLSEELKTWVFTLDVYAYNNPELLDSDVIFAKCRKTFEEHREAWLKEHPGKRALIKNGDILGVFDSDDSVFIDRMIEYDSFDFEIISEAEEMERARNCKLGLWELLSEPFLDIDVPGSLYFNHQVLKQRGFSDKEIKKLHSVLRTALGWNMFWWEWESFDKNDVILGWKLNLFLLTPFVSFPFFLGGPLIGFGALITFTLGQIFYYTYWYRKIEGLEQNRKSL